MKLFRKFLIGLCILVILIFVAVSLCVKVYGKDLLQNVLNASIKKDVEIGDLQFQFPLGLCAFNVNVEGIIQAKEVRTQISFDSILAKKLNISYVAFIKPVVNIEKTKIIKKEFMEVKEKTKPINPSQSKQADINNNNDTVEFNIKHLFVREGQIRYSNDILRQGIADQEQVSGAEEESANNDFSFKLEDVQITAEDIIFPVRPSLTKFQISARLAEDDKPLAGSRVEGSGWINVAERDMDGKLKITEADGKAGLTANIISRNNHMTVQGDLRVSNFRIASLENKDPEASSLNNLIFGALSSMGVEIGAKFSFDTKMDDFQLSNISFSGDVERKSGP
jgi:hypothetical protein